MSAIDLLRKRLKFLLGLEGWRVEINVLIKVILNYRGLKSVKQNIRGQKVMFLYKYRPWNQFTAEVLSAEKIYFPTRERLNDLAELLHPVRFEVSTWSDAFHLARPKISKEVFQLSITLANELDRLNAMRLLPGNKVDSSEMGRYFTLPDRFRRIVEAVFDRVEVHDAIRFYLYTLAEDLIHLYDSEENIVQLLNTKLDGLGVLSLSAECDCPVMWAHYSQNHQGVVIVLDTAKDRLIGEARPIEYATSRPTTTVNTVVENLYRKGDAWRYESEYRVLLKNGDIVQDLAAGAVAGVILGACMSEADRQEAINIARALERPFNVYEAYTDPQTFAILHKTVEL